MNLPQYNVQYTGVIPEGSTGIVFQPQTIQIGIGARVMKDVDGMPTEMVRITITLTEQVNENWKNEQTRSMDVSVEFLDCIDGFDKVELKPSINTAVLGAILSQFNLQLVP
jgi:hypothetical protein